MGWDGWQEQYARNQDSYRDSHQEPISHQSRLLRNFATRKKPRTIAMTTAGKSRKGIGTAVIEVVGASDLGAAIVHRFAEGVQAMSIFALNVGFGAAIWVTMMVRL